MRSELAFQWDIVEEDIPQLFSALSVDVAAALAGMEAAVLGMSAAINAACYGVDVVCAC